jgi:hypothetical protein
MYDVALSSAACVRAGTRADVAWMISPTASAEAVMITPGGGRLGQLAGGAFGLCQPGDDINGTTGLQPGIRWTAL